MKLRGKKRETGEEEEDQSEQGRRRNPGHSD